jgi:hypothetical protein
MATHGDTLTFGNFVISPGFYIIDTVMNTVTDGPPKNAMTYKLNDTNVARPPFTMGSKYIVNKWAYSMYSTYRYHDGGSCYGYSLFLQPFYLATINNVTPFTKTSADVMRITYTITEEDS